MRPGISHRPARLRHVIAGATLALTGAIVIAASPVRADIDPGGTACFDSEAPSGAGVVLNGTAARTNTKGFLNFYNPLPGVDPTENSSVNYTADANIANSIVTPTSDGRICVYSSKRVDAIADVSGYIAPTELLTFQDGSANRVFDTRRGMTKFPENFTFCFRVAANSTEGQAWFTNVTAVAPDGRGFLNVYPKGSTTEPDANSTINFVAGRNIANGSTVTTGTDGEICVYASNSTHVVVDVIAAVGASAFRPQNADNSADRVLDTRTSGGPIGSGQSRCVGTDAAAGEAVVVNATAVKSSTRGYLNVYPDGAADPAANSTINFRPDANIANGVIVPAGTDGRICVFANRSTQAVLDVAGYLTNGTFVPRNSDGSADRILDTRN